MATSAEDKRIIEAIIHKDDTALMAVYKQHKSALHQFISRQLNDSQVADELTQDVFLDFIEALRDFHFQCSIKTFLFTIAKNKVIDVIRKKKIKKILFSSMPEHVVDNITAVMFDDGLEKKELQKQIKTVLDNLPNDYQVVLRLKYVEGEKVQTIARKLSLGFKATESLIFRARKAFVSIWRTSNPV